MIIKDYGWHLRHLKKLAKHKRLRKAHLSSYGETAKTVKTAEHLQAPETKWWIRWWGKIKNYFGATTQP